MYGCVWRGGGLTAPSQCPWAHGRSTHSSPSRARIARAPCPWRGASGRPTGSGRWIYVGSLNSNFTEQPGQPQSSHRRDQRVVAGHCLTCGRLAASAHPKLDIIFPCLRPKGCPSKPAAHCCHGVAQGGRSTSTAAAQRQTAAWLRHQACRLHTSLCAANCMLCHPGKYACRRRQ